MTDTRPITSISMTAETLESLRASFNRRLRAEGKADRTLVLYGQSITYFSEFLAGTVVVAGAARVDAVGPNRSRTSNIRPSTTITPSASGWATSILPRSARG